MFVSSLGYMAGKKSKFQLHNTLAMCYCSFTIVCLLIITLMGNEQIAQTFENLGHFNQSESQSARRLDYFLSTQKITRDRSMKHASNVTYKWLFLTTFGIYRQAMDRHLFSMYDAAKRHPNINATLWGRDFPGLSTMDALCPLKVSRNLRCILLISFI